FGPRSVDLSTPDAANVIVIGEAAADRFGSALAIGDVNGGTSAADLIVGAPASKGPDPAGAARTNGGAAYALFGGQPLSNPGTTIKTIDLAQPASAAPVRVYGKSGSRLGSSLAIGDVNGGTAADIVLGAPSANRPDAGGDVGETGAVFVIFGG